MWDEEKVRALARENHGLVDRAGAIALGASDDVIRHQVEIHRWETVHGGVYYLNVTPRTWHTDMLAAVLAGGPEARASHRSASRLWGLDGVRARMIEITVPYSKLPIPEGVIVHRTRRDLPRTAHHSAIRSTTVERTLLDLAGILPGKVLEKAYMSALRLGHTQTDDVLKMMRQEAGRGVRGTRRLRRVIATATEGLTASGAEVEMAQLIRDCPIPQPVPQLRVSLPEGRHAYPDFAWPTRKKIVEVDGFEAHSTPEQLRDDLARQNSLMNLGWEMRRFTGVRVSREPEIVMDEITRFINQ